MTVELPLRMKMYVTHGTDKDQKHMSEPGFMGFQDYHDFPIMVILESSESWFKTIIFRSTLRNNS